MVDRNAAFADDVRKNGHTISFDQESQPLIDSHHEIPVHRSAITSEDSNECFTVRQTGSQPEIDDILYENYELPIPKPTGIIAWLSEVYKTSRGFELGTFNASLLPIIWKKQSANWDDLALGYISDIVFLVHNFTINLLSAICEDERVESALTSVLMDGLIERYKKSIDHTEFILHVERVGTPLTANHYFAENLEKR